MTVKRQAKLMLLKVLFFLLQQFISYPTVLSIYHYNLLVSEGFLICCPVKVVTSLIVIKFSSAWPFTLIEIKIKLFQGFPKYIFFSKYRKPKFKNSIVQFLSSITDFLSSSASFFEKTGQTLVILFLDTIHI